jgi:hypothetical protein
MWPECSLQVTTAQAISIMSAFKSNAARVEVVVMLFTQVGTIREHSGNIQGTFRKHSGNIQ